MTQMDHEVRKLKFLLKEKNKTMGRQGDTIFGLRCRVAELQEMIGKENRGFYRRLETMVEARDDELAVLRGEIDRLQEKLAESRETLNEA
jgi:DNA anti-recombination protein RmuC